MINIVLSTAIGSAGGSFFATGKFCLQNFLYRRFYGMVRMESMRYVI